MSTLKLLSIPRTQLLLFTAALSSSTKRHYVTTKFLLIRLLNLFFISCTISIGVSLECKGSRKISTSSFNTSDTVSNIVTFTLKDDDYTTYSCCTSCSTRALLRSISTVLQVVSSGGLMLVLL